MVSVAVCEDEPFFASQWIKLLEAFAQEKRLRLAVQCFSSGEAVFSASRDFDLVLMDIRLPGEDGITTMRRLRAQGCRCQLIFITAYPEHVFQAFDLDAVHYLVKPVTAETLFPVLSKAIRRAAAAEDKTYLLSRGGTVSRIRVKDILYCEAFGHQVTIHTLTEQFSLSGTLDALEAELGESFYRCHRSYLVNLQYVEEMSPGAAVLPGGGRVLIARRKQREFMQRLLQSGRKGGV